MLQPPHPCCSANLSLGSLESFWEPSHILLDRPLVSQKLNVCAVNPDLACSALLLVFLATKGSEAPVLGYNNLLAAGELVLRTAESFDGCGAVYS